MCVSCQTGDLVRHPTYMENERAAPPAVRRFQTGRTSSGSALTRTSIATDAFGCVTERNALRDVTVQTYSTL